SQESMVQAQPDLPASGNNNWWLIFYGCGLLVSIFLFLKKYYSLKKLFRYRIISMEKNLKIIEVPKSKIACTFYRTVFIGEDLSPSEKQHILPHEMVHVKQNHSLDLLFFELLKIIFWFNPLVYLFQRKIAGLHEYIADAEVVRQTGKKTYFRQLLNTAFGTENISFINQFFNQSLIKKRILMLQKTQSKSISKFRYLVIVPLMLMMLVYVACSEEKISQNTANVEYSETGEVITLKVQNVMELSETEETKRNDLISMLVTKATPGTLIITDGENSRKISVNAPAASSSTSSDHYINENGDVPFSVIEEVPVFPGCESLGTNKARKECMKQKITAHVAEHFDSGLGKKLGLSGINRIYVQFRINTEGGIDVLGVRAPHPGLKEEATRVINSLPQMTPGKQNGEEVGALYSLPIVLKIK
ncbi:MAG TPA: M56 family metallopeptidase, partial [Salinimicrobium sp.]|nr:M56 family metallopeptidase [Salinimicrobium sp.]